MKLKILLVFAVVLIVGMFVGSASAVSSFSGSSRSVSVVNYQDRVGFRNYYSAEDLNTYWPQLGDSAECSSRQDLLLQIAPGGCEPGVVRSDLLAEQNVPVFCQIDALEINPLIDIKQIRNVRFPADYPLGVVGVGFHPARAALRTEHQLLGSPLINNIGYVVVVLKREPNEDLLPEAVSLDLSAQLEYDAGNALGVGKAEFILEEISEDEWEREKSKSSFWQGRYFIRLESVESDFAVISIYYGDAKISTQRVERSRKSTPIYLPGFYYCRAGLELEYSGFVSAGKRARIEVSDERGTDSFEVFEGTRFLNERCRVESIDVDKLGFGSVSINCREDSARVDSSERSSGRFKLSLSDRNGTGNATGTVLIERKYEDGELESAFEEAISAYERVADDFPSERKENVGNETYGEDALIKAIELAGAFGKERTKAELINKFIEKYPKSIFKDSYVKELDRISEIDSSLSGYVVDIGNRLRTVRLADLHSGEGGGNARLGYGREEITLGIGEKRELGIKLEDDKEAFIELRDLKADEAVLRTNCDSEKSVREVRLRLGEEGESVCGDVLVLRDADTAQLARVRVLPLAQGTESEVPLTVNIGIEKRAIKLSTDKTRDLIENLDEDIERWESISGRLENVVKGLRGACFATSALLTFKNFATGLGGEAIARQQAMQGENGWTNVCKNLVAEREYSTLDACFIAKNSEIESDVNAIKGAIAGVNSRIEEIQSKYETVSGVFGDKSVNTDKVKEELGRVVRDKYGNEEILIGERSFKVVELLSKENIDSGVVGLSEMREMYKNLELKRLGGLTGEGSENVEKLLEDGAKRIDENAKLNEEFERAKEKQGQGFAAPFYATAQEQRDRLASVVNVESLGGKIEFKDESITHSSTVVVPSAGQFSGGTYVLGLIESEQGAYTVREVVREEDKSEDIFVGDFLSAYGIGNIKAVERVSYANEIKNSEVKYYETEPYKGMPAIVPFDRRSGWYAATKQTLPTFGGIGAFDKSGRVTSFWLCNVDGNGRIEFEEGFGDDICQLVNLDTGQPLGAFPGLSEGAAKTLVDRGVKAINDAANQYGNKIVRVEGEVYDVGRPAVGVPSTKCQDFMSPRDCWLMFNVCDPVICPRSRCDLGGNYPVEDVVQTGIVGSALLCLPNVKEGIFIPVCLTGIQAGIDGYASILRNHRDCLRESLETGNTVGICDQIYSIYACEFFWRQIAPVANVILPKLVEIAYGQGTRGGGEYLTVMSAWQNMQNSIEFFTQSYAVNSFEAFRIRSVDEAGGEFCKGFVSAKVPSDIDSLLEPESPAQFHAWFSSTRFSDASVPATAQYKVFYHIFAGKDIGAQYSVFLRDPPDSSYYQSTPRVHVTSGFIPRGQYASETVDFTAPEGYKELCVRINQEEKCGFKQVSTSFAINFLRDRYVEDQIAREGIISEKECISGSPSLGALVQPNIQAGAEEAAIPEIYERGVVRICASQNPGSQTNPTRFVDVGYCDDQKIRCWLDKRSVDRAITDVDGGVRNATLRELEGIANRNLEGEGLLLTNAEAIAEIDSLENAFRELNANNNQEVESLLNRIDFVYPKVLLNQQKARLLLVRAGVKARVAEVIGVREGAFSKREQRVEGEGEKAVTGSEGEEIDEALKDKIGSLGFFVGSGEKSEASLDDEISVRVEHGCSMVEVNVVNRDGDYKGAFSFKDGKKSELLGRLSAGDYLMTAQCLDENGAKIGDLMSSEISVFAEIESS